MWENRFDQKVRKKETVDPKRELTTQESPEE